MRTMYAALAALCFCSTTTARAEGPDALKILKRSMDHYDASKSVQCVMQILMKKTGAQILVSQDFKAETDGKGSITRSMIKTSTRAAAGKARQQSEQLTIDNGHEVYVVDAKNKRYFSQPHRSDRISKIFERPIQTVIAAGGVLKVAEQVVDNRPAYAMSNSKSDIQVLILVDKATYDLKQIHMKRKDQISDLTLKQQRLNEPIPASTFAWSPPHGYQKVTPPTGK